MCIDWLRRAALPLLLVLAAGAQAQHPDCLLPIDDGFPCTGWCPRWAYDQDLGECVEFIWGCCGGNANNFETWAECEILCLESDPCSLDPDPGPCDGACPRWYYDPDAGDCFEFIWGCCLGNANNFETREQCLGVCAPCAVPADPGPILLSKDADDVVLNWVPGVLAESWNVYRDTGPDPAGWNQPHAGGIGDSDPTRPDIQHRDPGALGGEPRYYYKVTALNACGESPLQ